MADTEELARLLSGFGDMREEAKRPTWGETQWRGPGGYLPLPEKDSLMARFLLNALGAPMALRSGRGAQIGRDNVMAGKLERRLDRMEDGPNPSSDRGITGGRLPDGAPHTDSSAGLSIWNRPGTREASQPKQYDYLDPWGAFRKPAANANEAPAPPAYRWWLDKEPAPPPRLELIPGGRKD
jgi:hypothetical protein